MYTVYILAYSDARKNALKAILHTHTAPNYLCVCFFFAYHTLHKNFRSNNHKLYCYFSIPEPHEKSELYIIVFCKYYIFISACKVPIRNANISSSTSDGQTQIMLKTARQTMNLYQVYRLGAFFSGIKD